jgi:hypothetical protein
MWKQISYEVFGKYLSHIIHYHACWYVRMLPKNFSNMWLLILKMEDQLGFIFYFWDLLLYIYIFNIISGDLYVATSDRGLAATLVSPLIIEH